MAPLSRACARAGLARLIYALLPHGQEYTDRGQDSFEEHYRQRVLHKRAQKANAMGMPRLLGKMTDRLNVVALRINHKCTIVVCVIVRAQARSPIVFSACGQCSLIKGIYLGAIFRAPCEVAARCSGWAAVRRRSINEPHIGLFAVRLRSVWMSQSKHVRAVMAFKADAVAKWRKGGAVKRPGARNIGHAKCHVVKHVGILVQLCCARWHI